MKKKEHKVPMQDLGINKLPTPDDVFEHFHKHGRTPSEGSPDENDFALPKHPSQEHGPVKVYTPEEIAQYEKERAADRSHKKFRRAHQILAKE